MLSIVVVAVDNPVLALAEGAEIQRAVRVARAHVADVRHLVAVLVPADVLRGAAVRRLAVADHLVVPLDRH